MKNAYPLQAAFHTSAVQCSAMRDKDLIELNVTVPNCNMMTVERTIERHREVPTAGNSALRM